MKAKRNINIAMLGQKRVPSREGGVEIVVEELSTRMVKLGHNVTCFNRKGHHIGGKEYDGIKMDSYNGVRLKQVVTIDKKGLAAMTASIAATILAAIGNYDVIHFHAEGTCVLIWFAKMCKKKCIVTIHGLDHQRAKWGKFARRYILFGEKCAVKYADDIVVLSKNVQQYFKTEYGRDTIFIPNGVNKPNVVGPKCIKEKFNVEKDDYILYLGRIVPEKGVHYLIEAFKMVNTNKKLIIAGGASDTHDYWDELIRLSQNDSRILFVGFVQGIELEELYSNAYVYVLPSDLEGMPLSLLEAMSYGNCCLVSDISECTEVVEDNAMIFKRGDSSDLAQKVQLLCDDKELTAKYKAAATDFICKKYNWDDVVRRTLEIYN